MTNLVSASLLHRGLVFAAAVLLVCIRTEPGSAQHVAAMPSTVHPDMRSSIASPIVLSLTYHDRFGRQWLQPSAEYRAVVRAPPFEPDQFPPLSLSQTTACRIAASIIGAGAGMFVGGAIGFYAERALSSSEDAGVTGLAIGSIGGAFIGIRIARRSC